MYLNKTNIGIASNQVAYPVGINKDAYYHNTYFCQDVETGEVTVENTVIKNYYSDKKIELFKGTAKECQQFIVDIVEKEGEWIRDERLKYVHQVPI